MQEEEHTLSGSSDKRKTKRRREIIWCGQTPEEEFAVVVTIRGRGEGFFVMVWGDTGRGLHSGSSDKRRSRREIIWCWQRHRKRSTRWQ